MKSALFAILFLASAAVAQESTTTTTNSSEPAPATTTNNNTTTTTTTYGSDHPSGRAGFGIHGGANFSNFNYSNNTYTNANRTGWLAGIHLEGWGWEVIAVRPEVNYSVRGYDVSNIARVSHSYLDIPLLFKFTPLPGPLKVYIEAGPQYSVHLNTKVESLGASTTYGENSGSSDFGILGGIGLGILMGDHALLHAEARYDWGLKNLSDAPGVDIKTRMFQAIAGITFLTN